MAYKSKQVETTVEGAIGDAFSMFEELAGEMRETADNMEGANMEHLPKYETASAAADELEGHDSAPEVPEFLRELKIVTFEQVNKNKRRAPSRAVRLSNAQSLMQAARDVLQEYVDKAEDDIEGLDDKDKPDAEAKKDEADQLIADLDEHCEFDVEFPGMFG